MDRMERLSTFHIQIPKGEKFKPVCSSWVGTTSRSRRQIFETHSNMVFCKRKQIWVFRIKSNEWNKNSSKKNSTSKYLDLGEVGFHEQIRVLLQLWRCVCLTDIHIKANKINQIIHRTSNETLAKRKKDVDEENKRTHIPISEMRARYSWIQLMVKRMSPGATSDGSPAMQLT